MAGQVPDPRTLNSWEDAFQHPLSVVRKLEQQLRKNIDDNRQKLRSLVGTSYRDLLGTAERIIEMDQQMETVETYLGDIGRKSNARTVEKIAENHVRMRKHLDARNGEKYKTMAQTKVLQSALTVVLRTIKKGGDALQASKLLVLSRLLYKNISEESNPPSILEQSRRKLAVLRSKLLSYIDRKMVKPSSDKALQAQTLCAYALVTSSTPKEVLRHFLQVRYEQLESKSESLSEADMLQMLDLYSQTLLDTRDLFPRRFSDTFSQLAKVPLFQDSQLQSLPELNLDIYGIWIAKDVRTFTPWVRHDQLTGGEVGSALESWSQQAQQSVLDNLRHYLKGQDDPHTIAETRQRVIVKYMSLSGRLRNASHGQAIQHVRESFLNRLGEVAAEVAAVVDLTFDEVEIPAVDELGAQQQRMWDIATNELDLSNGAPEFRLSILQSLHNRNPSIQEQCKGLDQWMLRINDMVDLTNGMRATKWDSDLDLDLEDLEDGDQLVHALSKDDPERLEAKLREATEGALSQVAAKVTSAAAGTKHAAFHLRMWREVDQRRGVLETRLQIKPGNVSLLELHGNLARSVSKDAISGYVRAAKEKAHVATTLWDGSPPLPLQPSPTAFRFVKTLHENMSALGNDLWSRQAVSEMSRVVVDTLSSDLDIPEFVRSTPNSVLTNGHLETDNGAAANVEETTESIDVPEDSKKVLLTQNLFDILYLRRIFSRSPTKSIEDDAFSGIVRTLVQQLQLEDALSVRIRKAADDYWKRTYLLFGLLACNENQN